MYILASNLVRSATQSNSKYNYLGLWYNVDLNLNPPLHSHLIVNEPISKKGRINQCANLMKYKLFENEPSIIKSLLLFAYVIGTFHIMKRKFDRRRHLTRLLVS